MAHSRDLSLSPDNTQVAKSSPEIGNYHIIMPAISLARAANVATHAWTKLYNEVMS